MIGSGYLSSLQGLVVQDQPDRVPAVGGSR